MERENDKNSNDDERTTTSSTIAECKEQLESLHRIVSEMEYDKRDYNNLYLLSADLLVSYAEKLQRDGLIPKKEQIKIFDEIFTVSSYIREKVFESTIRQLK